MNREDKFQIEGGITSEICMLDMSKYRRYLCEQSHEKILALISMIASLKSPIEREESNRDLHLKSASFQMQKMLSILLNWKNGIWT